nr:reverse transcriptase [Tanacetum cinerariifolium]
LETNYNGGLTSNKNPQSQCARNSKAHGGEEIEPNKIKESSRGILEDFNRANAYSKGHSATPNVPTQTLWSPPSNGVIKINTDGGISSGNSIAGIGFLMKYQDGSVLVAGFRQVVYANSVIEIEAYAILWAIHVALAKGFRNIILKTDSSILVDAFLHKELPHIMGLSLHIRRLCGSFSLCSWPLVRRDENRVAHELASRALYNNVDEVLDGFMSSSINS